MKFNEKLIELRKKEGLSQEELANLCGWTTNNARSTISKSTGKALMPRSSNC